MLLLGVVPRSFGLAVRWLISTIVRACAQILSPCRTVATRVPIAVLEMLSLQVTRPPSRFE